MFISLKLFMFLKIGFSLQKFMHKVTYRSAQEKSSFFAFRRGTSLAQNIFFAEKNKNHLFRRGFSLQKFAEKLRDLSRRHSAKFRGETPRNFAMGR